MTEPRPKFQPTAGKPLWMAIAECAGVEFADSHLWGAVARGGDLVPRTRIAYERLRDNPAVRRELREIGFKLRKPAPFGTPGGSTYDATKAKPFVRWDSDVEEPEAPESSPGEEPIGEDQRAQLRGLLAGLAARLRDPASRRPRYERDAGLPDGQHRFSLHDLGKAAPPPPSHGPVASGHHVTQAMRELQARRAAAERSAEESAA